MKKTTTIWGGRHDGEIITCEVVGELASGRKVWGEVLECGHHDLLFILQHKHFIPVHLSGWEWDYYENYHPCDCWIV